MKAVPLPDSQQVDVVEREDPVPGAGEALVRVHVSALCRSDMTLYDGDPIVGGGASPVWQSSIHAADLRSFLELLSFWGVFHVLTIAFHAASKRLDATRARMLNTACPPFFPQRCPEHFNR